MNTRFVIPLLLMMTLVTFQPALAEGTEPSAQDAGPLTYSRIVEDAMAQVPGISATDVYYRLTFDPNTLLVDVSDVVDRSATGKIVGGIRISLSSLPLRADLESPEELRYVGLQDRSRPIITTGQGSPNGARAAKLLTDMGFTDVAYMEGGMQAWSAASQPTNLSVEIALTPGETTLRPGEY